MGMTPVNSLTASYIQSVLGSALQGTASTTGSNSSPALQSDSSSLSPFARMLSSLQQLQQYDPAEYQQVTQQIAANLQKASETAQAGGNAAAATQLAQLSTDFGNASKTGQLPDVQDLAQAAGAHRGHGHHHHHAQATSGSTDSSQPGGAGNSAADPLSIIVNTLSQGGVQQS